jgi:transcriptional regulator with XRE-family HTH domain
MYTRWPKGSWMRVQSGATLRALMDQKNFSTARLGRYTDCSKSFIHRLCTGEKRSCSPKLAERIAEALDVPIGLLFVLEASPVAGRNISHRRGSAA